MSRLLPGVGTLPHLLQRPVVVLRVNRAGGTDEYGNQLPAVVERVDEFAYLEPMTSTEVSMGSEVYQADWRLVLAPGTPLDPWDRVEVPDLGERDSEGNSRPATFEVVGTPHRFYRPWSNAETQVQALLRRVTA